MKCSCSAGSSSSISSLHRFLFQPFSVKSGDVRSSNSQDLWIGLPLAGVSLLVLGGTSRLAAAR